MDFSVPVRVPALVLVPMLVLVLVFSRSGVRMVLMTRGRRAGRVYSRACSVAQEGEAWGCRAISELLFVSGSACQSLCVLAGAFVRASLPLVFSTSCGTSASEVR